MIKQTTKQAITTIIFDFANVLLFSKQHAPQGSLSRMYSRLSGQDSIWDHYYLNEELLEFLEGRSAEYRLAVLTASYNLPRHPEIKPRLSKIFHEVFLAGELPYNKQQPACYSLVVEKLGAQASQTLFIDDSLSKISAAEQAGLKTIHYQGNNDLFIKLGELGIR